ncbi:MULTISPECIES: VOC family protein [Paenibacillus]|uniref:VOC family protein n=1 Tax=Paenibacillus TaxID=44249 RepID=UPI0022B85B22|nr:VOC family protein [Paenibacillus caseinilyticus]MCZ8521238.1 VOC family protein [Paenibacillus caseinilyticus]
MLHHIECYVSDLTTSRAFWGWLLGRLDYRPYREWDGGVSFIKDGTYLVFVQAEERFLDIPYHRRRPGLNHLAFVARSREHVDEIATELEQRAVPLLYRDKYPYAGGPEHYAVFFEDPDRIKVEVIAPPEGCGLPRLHG